MMRIQSLLHQRFIKSVLLQAMMICVAYAYVRYGLLKTEEQQKVLAENTLTRWRVWVQEAPEWKEKTVKLQVTVDYYLASKSWQKAKGEALLYIQRDALAEKIELGDELEIPSQWKRIQASQNPGAFNYQDYCARQGIYFSQWVSAGHWRSLGYRPSWKVFFQRSSQQVRAVLSKYILDASQASFAAALLLGYRKGMDPEVYQDYSNTGLMHLIAISGMHIGMIYLSLVWLLQRIPFLKQKKIRYILPSLLGIWFFALLTGLPPSVLRSTVMFTTLAVGEMSRRKISIYNNLGVSACILLLFNPLWVMDPGFQLSYAAVFSLAMAYKPIYHLLYFKNKLLDKIWQLTSATLAAQIFTLPLSLYYFHQFPLLFLCSNLIGILLTTLILYLEIGLLVVSFSTSLSEVMGQIISFCIRWLNKIVHGLSEVKFATIQGIQMNTMECVLLYAGISFLLLFLFQRKEFQLRITLLLFVLLGFALLNDRWVSLTQKRFIIFNERKNPTLGFIHGRNYYFSGSPSKQQMKYLFSPAKIYFHLQTEDSNRLVSFHSTSYNWYFWNQQTILHLKKNKVQIPKHLKTDILLIDTPWLDSTLLHKIECSYVVYPRIFAHQRSDFPDWKPTKRHFLSENGPFMLNF